MAMAIGTSIARCIEFSLIHTRPTSPTRPLLSCLSSRKAHALAQLAPQSSPDLVKWVHRHGGYVHPSLSLEPSPKFGLGLAPSLPIPSGTPLISLPQHLMLSFSSLDSAISDSPESAVLSLAQRIPEELWALKLGLKLLMERAKKDSFWWPYISNLPQRFSLPFFFSGEEIQSLQYVPIIHQVKKRCRVLQDLAAVLGSVTVKFSGEKHPFGGQQVDANALGWAMAAVSSRAFRVHDTSQLIAGGDRKLLPLIDMCNHSFNPNARIIQQINEDATFLTVVAEETLQAGMPLLLNYGSLNNDLLLLDYGFVVPQNPHDFVELRYDGLFLDAARSAAGLRSAAFVSPAPWQQIILEQLSLQGAGASLQVNIGGPDLVDGRLLAALRVLFAQDSEAMLSKDLSLLQTWNLEAPLGHVNESNVLRTLIALCAIALGHFPTTISEDENALAKKDLMETSRLAIQYRLIKKQSLVDAMRGFTRKLHQLDRIAQMDKVDSSLGGGK